MPPTTLEDVAAVPSAAVSPDLSHINPKVDNQGHRLIVDRVLPVLSAVLQDPKYIDKAPLIQVREALWRVDQSGGRFWGANDQYTRKRTVEDIVLMRYHSDVRMSLL